MMNFITMDLNLLRVFDAVMRERNITVAGAGLGLTQPSTSNALKRLRDYCNDPLFVRTPNGMEPTLLAVEIAGPIAQALDAIRQSLERGAQFDPATSERTFKLMMTDIGEFLFLPGLMEHLQKTAPGIKVICQTVARERYREALETGRADLALGQITSGQTQLIQQYLFDDELTCLVRRGHPFIKGKVTLKQFIETGQVVLSPPSQVAQHVKQALGRKAIRQNIVLEVPHYMAIPSVLSRCDLITVIPGTLASGFTEDGHLRTVPLPFNTPILKVRQFWHQRVHHDPGHRWLRSEIAKMFAKRTNSKGTGASAGPNKQATRS